MAKTVQTNFPLLLETRQKIEAISKITKHRNVSDVIDLAVDQLYSRIFSAPNASIAIEDVVRVTLLPHPQGAEPVKLVEVRDVAG